MAGIFEELDVIIKHFPTFWSEAWNLFAKKLHESVKFDRKAIELILLAQPDDRRWETGVKAYAGAALDHGATPNEVRGAIRSSIATFSVSSAV